MHCPVTVRTAKEDTLGIQEVPIAQEQVVDSGEFVFPMLRTTRVHSEFLFKRAKKEDGKGFGFP